eukprot:530335-Prymnesium_polylepis.1
MIGYSDGNLAISRRSLDFDDVPAPTRWTAAASQSWGPLSLFQGLPQSVRPRLTARDGASQLPTWLAWPRHQGRCDPPPCEACLPAPLSQNVCAQR